MSDATGPAVAPRHARPVTVGVDGSDYADAALQWAVGEALRRQAPLRVVSVVDTDGDDVALAEAVLDHVVRKEAEEMRDLHAELAARLPREHPGLAAEFHIDAGRPAQQLAEEAGQAGVLVLGSRGRGGFAGLPIGSVSLHLAASAPCPVVVVPRGHAAAAHTGSTVVGFDRGESTAVLGYGLAHAALVHGEVCVLHAWHPYPSHSSGYVSDTDITARLVADEIAEWIEQGRGREGPEVVIRSRVERGPTDGVLIEYSARASLLVLGRHRRPIPFTARAGAVLRHVLMGAKCPVAVVPEP